jgi:sugar O-acyltransferase (sialic acid O-acetyltransferase NeuD family)
MEDLLIVGAGGTSQEIAEAVEAIHAIAPRWNLLGFLDDDPARHGQEVAGYPILGASSAIEAYPSARLIVGVAHYREPLARRELVERLGVSRARFAVVVHPSAVVSRRAALGPGTSVMPGAVIAHEAVIGEHVVVSALCNVGHEVNIGDCATLASAVTITSSARIESGAYLGAGSVIMNGVSIGEGAVVGIRSLVLDDVPPHTTVFGSPAKPLRRGREASG